MIVVRAPFRASFLGGGSDIEAFYSEYGGAVLSTAIDRHVFMTGRLMFDPKKTLVKYSSSELVKEIDEIKHPIFREALRYFRLSGLDLGVSSDVPAGTGLGSSSTFTVALVAILGELSNKKLTKHEIAELACKIEIEILGEPIGKQDQFASAIGGINLFVFQKSGEVNVESLRLTAEDYLELGNSLFLVQLESPPRSASEVLLDAKKNLKANPNALSATKDLASLAISGFSDISKHGIKVLPELLRQSWELKLKANPPEAMSLAMQTVDDGLRSGAIAAKLLGAGGGGFVLFFVEERDHSKFLRGMQNRRVLKVGLDLAGVTTIYREAGPK